MRSAISCIRTVSRSVFANQVRYSSEALPQLSSEKYNIKRKDFARVSDTDVNYFKSLLGPERVLTDESDVEPFNIDWIKNCRGQSKVVLKPRTTEEVSSILSYCNERKLAVCPQSGNTGLVGGSVPVFDEIVLSMTLMNKIIDLDDISGTLVCEAGCVLETLEQHVQGHELIMPLDLGAKGSCLIGGNVSTNAGGLRLLRYGNLHGAVLGLEAVKADGTVVDCLKRLRKDNTGYHLKHLFIGSEGTLGVLTKLALQCPVRPKAVSLGFFGLKSFEDVLQLYKSAKSSLGEILSAFEMADHEAVRYTTHHMNLTSPIAEFPFYVLLETHGSNAEHDQVKLHSFLAAQLQAGCVLDGTLTDDPAKMQAIWRLRESIPSAGLRDGYVFKYDVSLPPADYYSLVPALRRRLAAAATTVYGYGHIGDGNIHMNVTVPAYSRGVQALLEPWLYARVAAARGSVSAEHGVGLRKPRYLHHSQRPAAIHLMRQLKRLMDPNGILNPYKVLPDDE